MLLEDLNKYKILVSGASGVVGYGILRSLREANCYLIGTTIYPVSPADCFADKVEIVPPTTSTDYFEVLKKLISHYQVDMIIPGIEADMSAWNEHRSELEQTGTFVLLNNYSLVNLCLDKWLFFKELERHNCDFAINSSIESKWGVFEAPFLLKPRCGYGARGIIKVSDIDTFKMYRSEIGKHFMMQEIVGSEDEEYTASVFFDKNSNYRAGIMLKRKLASAGYTEFAEVADIADVKHIILQLAEIFRPYGPTNFQFRRHKGKWKLLEMNPRISSATSIRKAFGYNESKMCIDYFLEGKTIFQTEVKKGKAIRYTEDYVIYDSDNI